MSGYLGEYFDATSVAPAEGGALPKGDYTVAVVESEVKENSKGTGRFLAVTYQVLDGQFQGRKVWQYINFQNASAKAQQIGRGELSALCKACGVTGLSDSVQLHDIPIRIKVGHEPGQDGEDRAVVKAILWKQTGRTPADIAGGTGAAAAASLQPQPVAISEDDIPF